MSALVILCSLLAADPFQEAFVRANAAYEAGNFEAAIQQYEQIIASDVQDPAVFYNLGNAYYRNGKLGHAIANYERALRADAGFTAAELNLRQALKETRRNLAPPLPPYWEQAVLFWHYRLAGPTIAVLALLAWCLFWLLLALRLWRPIRYLRMAAAFALVLAAAFSVSLWMKAHPQPLAVVVEETVPVRFGASANENVHFELYEGDRVLIDARRDGWLRVVTVGNESGWAPEEALLDVGPPYELPAARTGDA